MSFLSFLGKVIIVKFIINELDVLFSNKLLYERISETKIFTEKVKKQIIKTKRLKEVLKKSGHEKYLPSGILEIRKMWKNRYSSSLR